MASRALAFDTASFREVLPNPGSGVQAPMPQGWQSPGNAGGQGATDPFPQQIADLLYNFPLSGLAVPTGTIGFVEPGIGTALPAGSASVSSPLLEKVSPCGGDRRSGRRHLRGGRRSGLPEHATGNAELGRGAIARCRRRDDDQSHEPSGPLCRVRLGRGCGAGIFTAYQSAFWDTTNNPQVISSSFSNTQQPSPSSPFHFAISELFVDAALRNISVFTANGDGGSGDRVRQRAHQCLDHRNEPLRRAGRRHLPSAPCTQRSRIQTLATITTAAMAGDKATIWALIAGRAHGPARSVERWRHADRDGLKRVLSSTAQPWPESRRREQLPEQQRRQRRRRPDPARAVLPERLRPRAHDVGSAVAR